MGALGHSHHAALSDRLASLGDGIVLSASEAMRLVGEFEALTVAVRNIAALRKLVTPSGATEYEPFLEAQDMQDEAMCAMIFAGLEVR